jgi:hypothetical protein
VCVGADSGVRSHTGGGTGTHLTIINTIITIIIIIIIITITIVITSTTTIITIITTIDIPPPTPPSPLGDAVKPVGDGGSQECGARVTPLQHHRNSITFRLWVSCVTQL